MRVFRQLLVIVEPDDMELATGFVKLHFHFVQLLHYSMVDKMDARKIENHIVIAVELVELILDEP